MDKNKKQAIEWLKDANDDLATDPKVPDNPTKGELN
jgi:hypothetical protein